MQPETRVQKVRRRRRRPRPSREAAQTPEKKTREECNQALRRNCKIEYLRCAGWAAETGTGTGGDQDNGSQHRWHLPVQRRCRVLTGPISIISCPIRELLWSIGLVSVVHSNDSWQRARGGRVNTFPTPLQVRTASGCLDGSLDSLGRGRSVPDGFLARDHFRRDG